MNTPPQHKRRIFTALTTSLLLGIGLLSPAAHGAVVRDTLVMLVPDTANLADWPVKVWTDSAAEEGIRLKTMTDHPVPGARHRRGGTDRRPDPARQRPPAGQRRRGGPL